MMTWPDDGLLSTRTMMTKLVLLHGGSYHPPRLRYPHMRKQRSIVWCTTSTTGNVVFWVRCRGSLVHMFASALAPTRWCISCSETLYLTPVQVDDSTTAATLAKPGQTAPNSGLGGMILKPVTTTNTTRPGECHYRSVNTPSVTNAFPSTR